MSIFKKKEKPLTNKEKVVNYVKSNPVEVGLFGLGVGNVVATTFNIVKTRKLSKKVTMQDARLTKVEKTASGTKEFEEVLKQLEQMSKKLERLSYDNHKINHALEDIADMIEFEDEEEEVADEEENPVIYTDEESETFGTGLKEIIDAALQKSETEISEKENVSK